MLARFLAILSAAALLTVPEAALPQAASQEGGPADAVLMVATVRRMPDGSAKLVSFGTAFFVSQDGTAITNSHVVYPAQAHPHEFALVAIADREFYSATVACASRLDYDPLHPPRAGVSLTRDVAEMRLGPPPRGISAIVVQPRGVGEPIQIASPHLGGMPLFPTLRIGRDPVEGQRVRVLGFGHISPIPYKWTATGQVEAIDHAADYTKTVRIRFSTPAQPGDSGGPVLNDHDEVVGIWTWYSIVDHSLSTAQAASAVLDSPCR